ncbi:hypothetical protein PUNSTDRAFT_141454 [Punctularia strigosozonata HHB-11173 SS5]|uniref:uncharacterized protein n=1 Tax=Punctularia strigosozonata (strain HHB-11173) TaxID=741275 RepID=UPI00044167BA|nr:uncharacterized protein PUNSTDRAFT_141454 [Punctularia strigosozonata HHB-11173 SS5]EIN12885.1 hypothetical protein PUNSTDRAFT_141454 [Punctularia strigosozonata HHB-11173 SS5]
MTPISVDDAELAGFFGETALYGISTTFLVASLMLLLRERRPGSHSISQVTLRSLLAANCFLLLSTTAVWCSDISRMWDGWVLTKGIPEGSLRFFAKVSEPRNVARTAILVIEAVVLDATLVYRVYVIWSQKWLPTLIPALTTFATLGMATARALSQVKFGEDIFNSSTGSWIASTYSLTLSTNIIAIGTDLGKFAIPMLDSGFVSALVSYKIIMRDRAMQQFSAGRLSPLLLVIVESAALTSILNLITLVTYEIKSNVQLISAAMTGPMIGISFGLIIVRVRLGVVKRKPSVSTHSGTQNSLNSVSKSSRAMEVQIIKETQFDSTGNETRYWRTPHSAAFKDV